MRNATRVWLAAGVVLLAACSKEDEKRAEGTFRIAASGGAGTTGSGGYGGYLYVESAAGGDVEIVKDGKLPAIPAFRWVRPSLGANPLTVSASTTVTPSSLLGDDGMNLATGLWVKPGVTLTLEPNADWDGIAGNDTVYFGLDAGALVEGAIVTGARNGAGADGAHLYLYASNVVVGSAGSIDTSGDDVGAGPGGNAGSLQLSASGSVFIEGSLLARGGRGVAGGQGGSIGAYGEWGMAVHAGTMDASGGAALNGVGGGAGYAEISVDDFGTALNTGTMRARGGDGTAGGGEGGWVYVENYDRGPAYSTGALEASGGDATVDGAGGHAGGVYVEAYGADAFLGGTVSAAGGSGAGTGSGGRGGDVDLYTWDTWGESGRIPAGRLVLGADVDVSGGAGAWGGGGGSIDIEAGSERASAEQPQIRLVGYSAVDVSGGRSEVDGGSGGAFQAYAYPAADATGAGVRLGSLRNDVPVFARGGDGATGHGASGGEFELSGYAGSMWPEVRAPAAGPGLVSTVLNRGEVDVSGGDGAVDGGNAGDAYLYDGGEVRTEAAIRANGGAAGTGFGGYGGYVELYGDAAVVSTATLEALGGASALGDGGDGGSAWVYGQRATCRDLRASGGVSPAATGGDGGDVGVGSAVGTSSFGTLSVAAGAGVTPGETGEAWVDGFSVALTGGEFRR